MLSMFILVKRRKIRLVTGLFFIWRTN